MAKKVADRLLQRSEKIHMALMQQLMHGVSILQDDVHKFANVAMADITGYSVEELSGMPYLDIVAPEDKAGAQLAYEAIMAENTGDIANLMGGFEMVCKDGSVKQVEVDNSVITIGGKKAVLSVVQDISSRKRAEEARRETERRFIAFINNFPGIAFLKDTRGNYLYTNSLFDEVMKSNKARSAARNGGKQRANKSPIRLDRTDKLVLKESKTVSTVERVVQHKRPRFLLIYKFPIIGDSGIVNSIGGIGLDITERRNIEIELKKSRERLSDLNANLNKNMEEHSARIAREIHDELGQMLTSLKFDLAWLESKMTSEQTALRNKTAAMAEIVDQAITSIVRIASELRPRLLDELGLISAIRWYVDEFQKRTNIECRLLIEFEEIYFEKTLSTTVFRILQETLTNIARHSGASIVNVELKKSHNTIVLRVMDDGKGITQEQIDSPDSFGLLGIKERVNNGGGTLIIHGVPKKGTEIEIALPIK